MDTHPRSAVSRSDSKLSRLPPELWEEICSHLAGPDLGNFRLACKFFEEIGARILYREIVIYLDEPDFD